MRCAIFLFVLASVSGCKSVDCGKGTIERNGTCAPADETTDTATCGSGTMLDGDRCVPVLPPTKCDPATTMETPDPNDPSITICVGTGTSGGCDGVFACSQPASGKQTICGQLYNIEDNSKFQGAATGKACAGTETTGPCALAINAYDALAFGNNQMTPPLTVGGVYIDDCGRFRLTDVSEPADPFIGLGFDDRNAADMGPTGVTNATGVAVNAVPDSATSGVEAWVAPKSTTDMWTASGGPPVSGGIYVSIFRTHKCAASANCSDAELKANQSGVTITKMGSPVPSNDYYFKAADVGHTMIDMTATATGVNGTGLLTNASVNDSLIYSGTGGITDPVTCTWESHAAASLANIVFFQIYRPKNQPGQQCAQ